MVTIPSSSVAALNAARAAAVASGQSAYGGNLANLATFTGSVATPSTVTPPAPNPVTPPILPAAKTTPIPPATTSTTPPVPKSPVLPPAAPDATPQNPLTPSTAEVNSANTTLGETPSELQGDEQNFEEQAVMRSQSLIDSIEKPYNDQLAAAESNARGESIAEGSQGTPESSAAESNAAMPILNQQAAAVASAVLSIQQSAASTFGTLQSDATTNASDTLANYQSAQKDLQATAAQMASVGYTAAQLQESNPQEYQYMLEYGFNGDPNAMAASMLANVPKETLLNSGQPLYQSGSAYVYGVQAIDPTTGKMTVKTETVQLPQTAPPGYTVNYYNQASNGSVAYVATPSGGYDPSLPNGGIQGGIIGGSTSGGLSSDAINELAQNWLTTGKMPVSGMGSSAVNERTAIYNAAAEMGTNPAAAASSYKALSSALSTTQKQYSLSQASETTANSQVPLITASMANISQSDMPYINNALNAWNANVAGGGARQQFVTYLMTFANEYAKIMSGSTGASGSTDSARSEALSIINAGMSPSQIQSTLTAMQNDMSTRMNGYQSEIDTINGSISQIGAGDASGADTTTSTDSAASSTTDTTDSSTGDSGYANAW